MQVKTDPLLTAHSGFGVLESALSSLDSAARLSSACNPDNQKYSKVLSKILNTEKANDAAVLKNVIKPSVEFSKAVACSDDKSEDLSVLSGEVRDYIQMIRAYAAKLGDKGDDKSSAASVMDDLNSTVELVISGAFQKSTTDKEQDEHQSIDDIPLDFSLNPMSGDLLGQAQAAALKQLQEDTGNDIKGESETAAGAAQMPQGKNVTVDQAQLDETCGIKVRKLKDLMVKSDAGVIDDPFILKNFISLNEAVSLTLQDDNVSPKVITVSTEPVRVYPLELQKALDDLDAKNSNDVALQADNTDSGALSSEKAAVLKDGAGDEVLEDSSPLAPEFDDVLPLTERDDASQEEGELLQSEVVNGNDFNCSDALAKRGADFKVDGNPDKLRETDRKALEQYRLQVNQDLGRRLDSHDFYDEVKALDPWLKDIGDAGFKEGPAYSALSCAARLIDPNDPNCWTLEMSSDFALLINDKSFCDNLSVSFSKLKHQSVKIMIVPKPGIPKGCPEDLARHAYVAAIDKARVELSEDPKIVEFLKHLGEDVTTVNLGLYTQKPLIKK